MVVVDCPYPDCDFQTTDASDALAATLLQIHAAGAHSTNNQNLPSTARIEKVKRPTISIGGTTEGWSYFNIRWKDYVAATKVSGRDLVVQLLECCDEDLRKDLTRAAGGSLTNKTEEEVLTAIKTLAVREENAMVARVALHDMRQDRDEPIRSFGARIRGQAAICKYLLTCTCGTEMNYSNEILRDVVVRGLVDSEIQLDLLSDSNQNMTLEEVFQFVEKKEAGRRSANRLMESQGVQSMSSQYKKQQRLDHKETSINKSDPCTYCGKRGHGKSSPVHIRKQHCSAYDTTCEFCKKLHHFDNVCRSKQKQKNIPGTTPRSSEAGIFDSLCYTSHLLEASSAYQLSLDHHLYDNLQRHWFKSPSHSQPFITLKATVAHKDYEKLGFASRSNTPTTRITAMADTGCQSCLMGIKLLHPLGLRKTDLIPVSMKMHAANSKKITILGAVILELNGTSTKGRNHTTKQIVYVTDESDKFFLSRHACMELGMISTTFPRIGEVDHQHDNISSSVDISAVGTPSTLPSVIRDQTPCSDSPTVQTAPAREQSSPLKHLAECGCPMRKPPPPSPTEIPFPATEANRLKLQNWLVEYYSSSAFNTCKHQILPKMDTKPLHLMLQPDAIPKVHHTPAPVPIHWQEEVKSGLDRDVKLGVGEPVTWCHRMVICAKKDGSPRRTVDLQALNAYAIRETHHTQSPFHQARSVPANKKKTVFDCWNGYHSVPLHKDDRHLTTFITPWGRYRYKVAPQGYKASGDGYSRRMDEILSDTPNFTKCIDDTLLWADNLESSFFQAVEFLGLCSSNGITLNPEKFQFGVDVATFAGFEITMDSVKPCSNFLESIEKFPTPQNIHDIRSWFGLINQVSYAFASSTFLQPFRHLLQPSTPFIWTNNLNQIFQQSKKHIIQEVVQGIKIFDRDAPTCLATDWSRRGIGFWLLQKHCSCDCTEPFCCEDGWKTVLVGSRFTNKAESHYAPIEGEALALVDALDKARHFTLGCRDLLVAVDHKPLLKIFSDRALSDIPNPRLRRFKERSLRYHFRITHIPGAKHKVPDALSRYPVSPAEPDDDVEVNAAAFAIKTTNSLQAITWDRVKIATQSDKTMLTLLTTIEDGFPATKQELHGEIQEYFQYKDDLYSIDGVAFYKDRIIMPKALRQEVLDILHAAHQSVTPMIARTSSSVFWPGITIAIQAQRSRCNDCNRNAPSHPNLPPYPPQTPEYPFQCICADFFHYEGSHYLVAVDRYSNWPIIERAHEGSKGLIDCLRRIFATYGIPDELASDGGPEFTASATSNFLRDWGTNHRLSSVAFPHSNCRAEVAVKTAKRIIMSNTGPNGSLDTDFLQRAILQYRNTPDPQTGLSPAMCLFGRPIRDFIPILPGRYQPHPTWIDTLEKREQALRNRHMKSSERWSLNTRPLPPLRVGDHVRLQNQIGPHPTKWDKTGRVIEVRQFDQYVIRMDGSGRQSLRNRRFLRKFMPAQQPVERRSILQDLPHIVNQKPYGRSASNNTLPPAKNNDEPLSSNDQLPTAESSDDPPTSSPPTPPTFIPDQSPSTEETSSPTGCPTPTSVEPKTPRLPPLALRRLMDYNAKGLKE